MEEYPIILRYWFEMRANVYLSNGGDYKIKVIGLVGVEKNTQILIKGVNVSLSFRKIVQLIEELEKEEKIKLTHPFDEIIFRVKDQSTLEIIFNVNFNILIKE